MDITVRVLTTENVNFAAYHCGYLPIRSIDIKNGTGKTVILRIYSEPEFLYEYKTELTLDRRDMKIEQPKVQLDASFYRQELLEAREGTIKVELLDSDEPEKVLAFDYQQVHLQPYLHWNRDMCKETLTAFMQPNDPLVAKIMNRAGELANEEDGRMVAYFEWKNTDVLKQAEWIYRALQEENIHYLCAPPGYEMSSGQKLRIPHHLLHEDVRQGTCLDLAVLYATCLEAASLHPVLFVIPGHAFAGVWTGETSAFSEFCCTDEKEIRTTCQSGKLVPVECTFYTDGLGYSFQNAVSSGMKNIEGKVDFALDVCLGRSSRYVPAFTFTDQPICGMYPEKDKNHEAIDVTPAKSRMSKLDRLKNQAMDFTMKNSLLAASDPCRGISFSLDSERFFKGDYGDLELLAQMKQTGEETAENITEDRLYAMQSADQQMQKACGQRILYLSVNVLEWLPSGSEEVKHAPLYLFPAEIYRNVRGEYVFTVQMDRGMLNPVLAEYLNRNFGIDLSDWKIPPTENYAETLEHLAYIIGRQEGWKILSDTACLNLYRVPNEAILKGLSDEKLLEHAVVKGLLDGAMTWNNAMPEEDGPSEDEDTIYAFPADSSQSSIIRSVYKKRAQVVTGPAGNGKSQTIANIIIEYMRRGRNVLFVAEKLSAMNVIREMLESVGLAPFCLNIPDGSASLSEVKRQIETALRTLSSASPDKYDTDSYEKRYLEAAGKLHQYEAFMKTKGKYGWSMAELLEQYAEGKNLPFSLEWQEAGEALNREDAMEIMLAFQEAKRQYTEPEASYLEFIRWTGMTEAEEKEAKYQVRNTLETFEKLREKANGFQQLLNINFLEISEKAEIQQTLIYASVLLKCPVVGPSLAKSYSLDSDELSEEIQRLIVELMATAPGSRHYDRVSEQLWSQVGDLSAQADSNNEWQMLEAQFMGMNRGGLSMEQIRQMSLKAKFDTFCKHLLSVTAGKPDAEREAMFKAALMIGRGQGAGLSDGAQQLCRAYEAYNKAQSQADPLVIRDGDGFAAKYPDKLKNVLFEEWFALAEDDTGTIKKIYTRTCRRAYEAGLGSLIRQMEQQIRAGLMNIEQIPAAFEKCRCAWNIEYLRKNMDEFKDFAGLDFDVCLKQYRENETLVRDRLCKNLPSEIMAYMPDMSEGINDSTELGALQKIIRQNSSRGSIRQIFEEAPEMMRRIFPCTLIGPESVAEYIPADTAAYDLVIFDEASQLPTYKALIPVSRGCQSLFIGDEKQLTPTAFFKKNIVDESGIGAPAEAVLEDAIITSMPQKMLRYHYRSKYEGLMAFSNDRYYNGEIVTFPNPDMHFTGIHWEYVADGCYDRGGTRCNREEAVKVIDRVRDIYSSLPEDTEETLGIITFNLEQMRLLQSMIREKISDGGACSRQMEALVDVVNLEACQGREWDRTILSMTYGPDTEGHFSSNLGPMTREEGGHRLNVMITRSRKELFAVSSMTPEMFGENPTGGNRDVRDFMAFARGDFIFDTSSAEGTRDKEARKGLSGSVAARLEAKGYVVHTNIGSSSCKVDIGIASQDGQSYRLGILLDDFMNSSYHVRDKEVVTPDILKARGWKIYRLHAMNWYDDAEFEMQKIEKLLAQ